MDRSNPIPDDGELLDRVLQKDEPAFRMLYERYHQRIYNLAYHYTGSLDDAEEITQDVFIKVYQNCAKFRRESRFGTWLYRIAVNTAMNFKRRKSAVSDSLDEMAEPGSKRKEPAAPAESEPQEEYKRKKQRELIQSALDTLPKNQRAAFVMAVYEGMSYLEISEVLAVSVSAVESLIFRARQGLVHKLKPRIDKGGF